MAGPLSRILVAMNLEGLKKPNEIQKTAMRYLEKQQCYNLKRVLWKMKCE